MVHYEYPAVIDGPAANDPALAEVASSLGLVPAHNRGLHTQSSRKHWGEGFAAPWSGEATIGYTELRCNRTEPGHSILMRRQEQSWSMPKRWSERAQNSGRTRT